MSLTTIPRPGPAVLAMALCVFSALPSPSPARSIMDFTRQAAPARAAAAERPPEAAGPRFLPGPASLGQQQDEDAGSAGAAAVDLSALRYFARTGDSARYDAEIARLRRLHPDWTPPADPRALPEERDAWLDETWALLARGQLPEVTAAIARREEDEPGWSAPDDLVQELERAELRQRLVGASDLRQFDRVLALAVDAQSQLTCRNIDLIWRVAEAYAQTGAKARARDAYVFIMRNCDGADERLATAQKAVLLLDRDLLDGLFAAARPMPGGGTELDAIRDDVARNMVMLGGVDEEFSVREDDLARLGEVVERDRVANDATLLGWYHLRRANLLEAGIWFEKALGIAPDESSAQGLALIRIARGELAEAEDLMYPWRDASPEAHDVYMAAVSNLLASDPRGDIPEEMLRCLDPERIRIADSVLERIAPEIVEVADVPAAQNMGWYAFSFSQYDTAARWFSLALEWDPDHEPSAYGLALSLDRLGQKDLVDRIQSIWAGRSDRIARLAEICDETGRPVATDARSTDTRAVAGRQPYMPSTYLSAATASRGESYLARSPRPRPRLSRIPSSATRAQPAGMSRRADAGTTAPAAGATPMRAPARISAAPAGGTGLQRAWDLMESGRTQEAIPIFKAALASGSQPSRRDAAYGLSLAYLRLGMVGEAAAVTNSVSQPEERNREIQTALLADQAVAAFDAGQFARTLNLLDRRARIAPERIDLMVLRGWAYHNLGRDEEASRVCKAAGQAGSAEGMKCHKIAERAYWGSRRNPEGPAKR